MADYHKNKHILEIYTGSIRVAQMEDQLAEILLPVIVKEAINALDDAKWERLIELAGDKLSELTLGIDDVKNIIKGGSLKSNLEGLIQEKINI